MLGVSGTIFNFRRIELQQKSDSYTLLGLEGRSSWRQLFCRVGNLLFDISCELLVFLFTKRNELLFCSLNKERRE